MHFLYFCLTKYSFPFIIISVVRNGDVAQLARANGSYPLGQRFESTHRYHKQSYNLKVIVFLFYIKNLMWIRKGGIEKRPVDGFPDAARRIHSSLP